MIIYRRPSSWSLYSCVVCCSSVGSKPTLCSQCRLWVNKKWSGITDRMVDDPNYVCLRCNGKARPMNGRTVTEMDVDSTMLDVEATFCYLGYMPCGSAIAARCCVTWEKSRKLLPVKNYSGSTTMTLPWSTGSMASKADMKHPQFH